MQGLLHRSQQRRQASVVVSVLRILLAIVRVTPVTDERAHASAQQPANVHDKRGEDVREWMFQIENACRINGILIEETSTRLPGIAESAMEKPVSGWFLH
ncbi:hypothetical protein PR001_g27502 [Phytophthora rubi]|uniref:PH domain-containing protein n=1 Tax=Phytophthora rubi TaxID=129364 RepID=A0A6A3HNJ2_9STRA|nr:hypothetical protein PR001_g27502 [Phytophthora rubi]